MDGCEKSKFALQFPNMDHKPNPEFLRQKYQLEKSSETDRAVKKKERCGERVRNVPLERIQTYLDRLDIIFDPPKLEGHESFDRKARNVSMMKRFMHEALIVKPDVATGEYVKHQQRTARERGHGDVEVPERLKHRIASAVEAIAGGADIKEELQDLSNEEKQMAEEIVAKIEEQRRSLDNWMDYFASEDAKDYPDWFKYWAMRSVTGLSSFDKDEKRFPSRDASTVNPFPELDRAVLGKVLDVVVQDEAYKQKTAQAQATLKRAERSHNKERQRTIAARIAQIKQDDPNAKIDRAHITEEVDIAPFDAAILETEVPEDTRDLELETKNALDAKDFAALYALEFSKLIPTSETLLHNTKGGWVKYAKGTDHMPLVSSIERHQTGWCTAGEEVARSQLSRGDFYVYYSQDEDGNNAIPRAAIRMEGDKIAEVRGIAPDQNLDSYIAPVVQKKMHAFPDGKAYEKKAGDMQRLTDLEKKVLLGADLTKDDLAFLYEIDEPIQGFGYQKDPRVEELLSEREKETDFETFFPMLVIIREKTQKGGVCSSQELQYLYEIHQSINTGSFDRSNIADIINMRNPEADMPTVFECEPSQIARTPDQINENTKAYVGTLETGIFQKISALDLEYVYTSFPERRIARQTIEVGGKTREELLQELRSKGVNISEYAEAMMNHPDFVTSSETEEVDFIRLSAADLNIQGTPTTDAVYARAQALGLELVPPDAGPNYRLATLDQIMGDWVLMGMKQITDPDGSPSVFSVGRRAGGLWLGNDWARPDDRWHPDGALVFRLRKSET